MNTRDINGWDQWANHVLAELKRLSDNNAQLTLSIGKLHSEIAVLKLRAGAWGALAGAIPAAIAILYVMFVK